jgi:tetratricopeptide (TPR) repeat protein
MVFSTDETEGGTPPPPAQGPPSEALANALRLYQQEAYREASAQFQRVVEGGTRDAPANVQKAQFFLGKCLFHMGFFQSALSVFEEIVQQGGAHTYFRATLQWLAQLSRELPEPAGIIGLTGFYGDSLEVLSEFNTGDTEDLHNELLYLMGRHWYAQGEFTAARRFFLEVSSESDYYYHSRFFAGITHVRERHAQPAVRMFRDIVDQLDQKIFLGREERRFRDLAWLSLARIYYSTRHWASAIEAWNRIPPSSEYWLDSLFEQSWARFQTDGFDRALGNIHTLNSPYFDTAFYPEALVLQAVIYFGQCHYDRAEQSVNRFTEIYQPIRDELESSIRQYGDNTAFFEFLRRVQDERAELSPEVARIVRNALSDRTVLRNIEYVRVLDEEEQRLNATPPAFQNSTVGARILQDIAAARAVAIDNAGNLARGRFQRLLEELQELLNQSTAILIEILNARRGELTQEMLDEQASAVPTRTARAVEGDAEHVIWPFKGEYWRDELGFYRQPIASQCGR